MNFLLRLLQWYNEEKRAAFITDPCPVCGKKLEVITGSSIRSCGTHRFRDRRARPRSREPLMNEGDHRGEL